MAYDEPPHIDSSLDPIRAAIQMVADGSAKRVTVYTPETARLLPAARMLARAAGVAIESADGTDTDPDLVVVPASPRTA
jgi:hypothetical protein